jgi:hypothetical protein
MKFQADPKDLAVAKDLTISEHGRPVQAAGTLRKRESAHKSRAGRAHSSLRGCMFEIQHQQGGERAHQRDQGDVSGCRFCRA